MTGKDRLIVALDVGTEAKALELVDKLKGAVDIFKVGSELFTSCGPRIIDTINKKGCKVFLDLKFHDIPNTAARAAGAATELGVFMMNLHSLGGYEMMREAAKAVEDEAEDLKIAKPKLLAVTILTSMDENGLKKIGINDNMKSQVLKLAKLARDAGLDGVVASPQEVRFIREELGKNFLIVTPGVRPSWASSNDQKRVLTPKEAIENGADYIVIGRPITEAKDPEEATRRILKEIE
jgi:orotidine-5'-phosphate decarboxylase